MKINEKKKIKFELVVNLTPLIPVEMIFACMSFISSYYMRIIVRLNSSEYIQLNVTLSLLPYKRGHYTNENYFGSLRVRVFQSHFFFSFKLYPEASSGWRFDRAYLLLQYCAVA